MTSRPSPPGEDAAALAVGHHRQGQGLGAAPGRVLGLVGPDVGPQDQHRPLGLAEQPGHRGQGVRVGVARGRRAGGIRQLGRPLREQRLKGDVEEHRAPVRLGGQAQRPVDLAGDGGDVADGAGVLGDGGDQRRVVELLEAAGAPAAGRGPAPQHQHGRAVEVGGGDGADPVGHPGPGGEDGQPGPAQQLGRGLGREHGRLLVADVDQPQRRVGRDRPVVQGEHVPAGQGEQLLDPVAPGRRHGQRAPVPLDRPAQPFPPPILGGSPRRTPLPPAARCYPGRPHLAELTGPAGWADGAASGTVTAHEPPVPFPAAPAGRPPASEHAAAHPGGPAWS